jgi:hypothetical protein
VRCSSSPSLSFLVPHRLILLYDYPQRRLLCDGCLDELLLVDGDGDLVYGREDVNVNVSAYRATVLLEIVQYLRQKASASGC